MFLHASIQGYKKYKNWYRRTRSSLIKNFSADYKLVAGLISATSPRRDVSRNVRIALVIYKAFKQNSNIVKLSKKDFSKRFELMTAHYNNVIKTLTHNFNKPLELSGNKVNAFYNNMIGNYDFVTIDVWMLRIMGVKTFNGHYLSTKQYNTLSNIISEIATEQNLLPAELQAILWIKYKAEIGNVIKKEKHQLHKFKPIEFKTYIEKFA